MPREGHDLALPLLPCYTDGISIHVPREGHDVTEKYMLLQKYLISIHVPREGHDMEYYRLKTNLKGFQSTCPARGTTQYSPVLPGLYLISIHVPREGHDFSAKL